MVIIVIIISIIIIDGHFYCHCCCCCCRGAGLDHTRALVYEHCKKLLQNLLLLGASQEHSIIARLLLTYRSTVTDTIKVISEDRDVTATPGRSGLAALHPPRILAAF